MHDLKSAANTSAALEIRAPAISIAQAFCQPQWNKQGLMVWTCCHTGSAWVLSADAAIPPAQADGTAFKAGPTVVCLLRRGGSLRCDPAQAPGPVDLLLRPHTQTSQTSQTEVRKVTLHQVHQMHLACRLVAEARRREAGLGSKRQVVIHRDRCMI